MANYREYLAVRTLLIKAVSLGIDFQLSISLSHKSVNYTKAHAVNICICSPRKQLNSKLVIHSGKLNSFLLQNPQRTEEEKLDF